MAVILYRHTQRNGHGFTGAWALPLNDSGTVLISEFAYETVCWFTMKADDGDNKFDPGTQVTHQEANAIFESFGSCAAEK